MYIIIQSPKTEGELPNYEMLEFYRGDDTHTELTVQCYDLRFHITVSATNIQDDEEITKEYLSLLRKLDTEEEDSESDEGDAIENMCFWIASKYNSAMRILSSREEKTQVRTLHDWFYAKTLALVLRARDGKLYVCSSSIYQQDLAPKVTLSHPVCELNIPSIEASYITILPDETDEENLHYNTLADIDLDNTPVSIRMKWKDQLQSMIHSLHSTGIIWGDAKSDNVLVAVDDNL